MYINSVTLLTIEHKQHNFKQMVVKEVAKKCVQRWYVLNLKADRCGYKQNYISYGSEHVSHSL